MSCNKSFINSANMTKQHTDSSTASRLRVGFEPSPMDADAYARLARAMHRAERRVRLVRRLRSCFRAALGMLRLLGWWFCAASVIAGGIMLAQMIDDFAAWLAS